MKKPTGGIRWSVLKAATDFGVARETLTKLLKQAGQSPGEDGCYSTRQIYSALSGDLRAEKIKLTREQIRKLEIENAVSEGELIRADWAIEAAQRIIFAARQIIVLSKLSLEDKNAVIRELRALGDIDWRNLKGYDEREA